MDNVATSNDPSWPSAATLLASGPVEGRRNVGLIGLSTYATSVSPRSATSTPAAIRAALERYSTWSFSEAIDIAESVGLVDFGDVSAPDAEGGAERVAVAMADWDPSIALRLILGGDNAATWHALRALSGGDYSNYGLVTLDAHLDMHDAGVHVISRDVLRQEPVEEAARRGVSIAGAGGRHVYVDIDMDAADRTA